MLSELRSKTKLVGPIRVGGVGKKIVLRKTTAVAKEETSFRWTNITWFLILVRALQIDSEGTEGGKAKTHPDVPLPPLPPHVETTRKVSGSRSLHHLLLHRHQSVLFRQIQKRRLRPHHRLVIFLIFHLRHRNHRVLQLLPKWLKSCCPQHHLHRLLLQAFNKQQRGMQRRRLLHLLLLLLRQVDFLLRLGTSQTK